MPDRSPPRHEIISEIEKLTTENMESVQDATFIGWEAGKMDAHAERNKRLTVLHKELAALGDRNGAA